MITGPRPNDRLSEPRMTSATVEFSPCRAALTNDFEVLFWFAADLVCPADVAMNARSVHRLAFRLNRSARHGETHVGDVQSKFASACPIEKSYGCGHFVMSRRAIGIEPVRFHEHVRHVVASVSEGAPPLLHQTRGQAGDSLAQCL